MIAAPAQSLDVSGADMLHDQDRARGRTVPDAASRRPPLREWSRFDLGLEIHLGLFPVASGPHLTTRDHQSGVLSVPEGTSRSQCATSSTALMASAAACSSARGFSLLTAAEATHPAACEPRSTLELNPSPDARLDSVAGR